MAKTNEKTELIHLDQLKSNQIIAVTQLEEEQRKLVKDNPFIEIVDNETYNKAKQHRTALLKGKTSLLGVNGQENVIKKALNDLKNSAIEELTRVAGISIPKYEKQQEEVKRWEQILEDKREEARLEAERLAQIEEQRKTDINNAIEKVYTDEKEKIDKLSFSGLEEYKAEWEKYTEDADVSQFQEFEVTFYSVVTRVNEYLESKETVLTVAENQRLENIRLEAEREKLKAERLKREAEQAKIDAENAKKAKEMAELKAKLDEAEVRIKKAEDDRIAKEQEEILKKAEIAKEKAIEKQKAKQAEIDKKEEEARLKRIEELKPDKEKLKAIIKSIQYIDDKPKLKDKKSVEFLLSIKADVSILKNNLMADLTNLK